MVSLKVHIIHVGNMSNKGTQALLKTDISIIREILNSDVRFSVSTTDIEGVRKLNLPLEATLPPVVDIPYERADSFARKLEIERGSKQYKVFALASLIFMFIQMVSSILSAVLVKAGLKGFYRSEVLKRIEKCDLAISYSDENFKEAASYLRLNVYWVLTWWSMLVSRTWDILVARYFGKPVVMFPNSVGPFRTFIGRFLSRLALNSCSLILIREPISYKIARSLDVKTPKILTYDTTWLFKSTENSLLKGGRRPCVGVSAGIYAHVLSESDIKKHTIAYAKALDEAVERFNFSVVFLPHYISGFRYDDLEVSKMILQNMKSKKNAMIVEVETADEFKSLLDKMDMVISSKMHPAVLALSAGVPTLCVAYDHKQMGLFESLDMAECTIPLCEFSKRTLFSRICYVWHNREKTRTVLDERVPLIQQDIREAIKRALPIGLKAEIATLEAPPHRSQ